MVGGFNTNVAYRGRTFHVQTEDSGRRRPKIVTLLYEGGTILTSRKSSYEDRLDEADVEAVVRELMEEQHREMVAALRVGQLDETIGIESPASAPAPREPTPAPGPKERDRSAPRDFGRTQTTDRTLDVVVLEHLRG